MRKREPATVEKWGPKASHLDAKPLARPRHLARRVDDGLAHGAFVEHRELNRDLCRVLKKKKEGKGRERQRER